MATCGNCGDTNVSADLIKICYETRPGIKRSTNNENREAQRLQKIVTTNCMNPVCKVTKTGPLGEVAGFRCPEHQKNVIIEEEPQSWFPTLGDRVLWHGKRYQVKDIQDQLIGIKTGPNVKLVPLVDISE